MNIILALNSFKNYIDSIEACSYLKKRLNKKIDFHNKIRLFPMADGGEYTAKVLCFYCKSKKIRISTYDIFKKKISIQVIEFKKNSVFIGTSDILGARNYNISNIDPSEITSYGLGYALKYLSKKYKNIYVGMGGTLIADGGSGAVEGYGGKFIDYNGHIPKSHIFCNVDLLFASHYSMTFFCSSSVYFITLKTTFIRLIYTVVSFVEK